MKNKARASISISDHAPISINTETFNDDGRLKKYAERWDIAREKFRREPEFRKAMVESYLAIRDVSGSAVHSNAFMQNFSLHYANGEFIGEQLMPVVSVDKRSDKYAIYPKREIFAYPDDSIAQRGRANEISESRSEANYSVNDYAFVDYVSTDTVDNQDAIFDEMKDCIEKPLYALAFKREQRIATIMTTGANFGGNTNTPSVLWDAAANVVIAANIQAATAALYRGAGDSELVGYTSLEVWNVMSRDPLLRDLFKYVKEGLGMPQQIAQYLGLSKILVSESRQDTANSGQTAAYSRIFGKHFGIVRVAKSPTKRSAHFGTTFRLRGMPLTTQWFDPSLGTKGGTFCKQACSEDHKIVAPDTGYLLTSVIS